MAEILGEGQGGQGEQGGKGGNSLPPPLEKLNWEMLSLIGGTSETAC